MLGLLLEWQRTLGDKFGLLFSCCWRFLVEKVWQPRLSASLGNAASAANISAICRLNPTPTTRHEQYAPATHPPTQLLALVASHHTAVNHSSSGHLFLSAGVSLMLVIWAQHFMFKPAVAIYRTHGGVAQWLEHLSLTGGSSLTCAPSMVDSWPLCG